MKKILGALILFFFLSAPIYADETNQNSKTEYPSNCVVPLDGANIKDVLGNCKPKSVAGVTDYQLDKGLKIEVYKWVKNISLTLGFIAVAMLVYAGFLFQFAAGEDENISKAKNLVKMTLIGFFLLISAGSIVFIIINVFYSISGN